MAKFHITKKGTPGRCTAQDGNCPLGSDNEHYATQEQAREAFEQQMAGYTFPSKVADQREAAKSTATPAEALAHLVRTTEDEQAFIQAGANPNLTPEAQEEYLVRIREFDDYFTRRWATGALASNPSLTPELRARIERGVLNKALYLHRNVAIHSTDPEFIAKLYAMDEEGTLRGSRDYALESPAFADREELVRVARSFATARPGWADGRAAEHALANPSLPDEVVEEYVQAVEADPDKYTTYAHDGGYTMNRKWTPEQTTRMVKAVEQECLRSRSTKGDRNFFTMEGSLEGFARYEGTPEEDLRRLYAYPHSAAVRKAAGENLLKRNFGS